MIQQIVTVSSREEVAEGIFVLRFQSEELARMTRPGQFVNVRAGEEIVPLLRRPFSVSRVQGSMLELVFNVVGKGTQLLSLKRPGDQLDVLGPLGVPFNVRGDFDTALIVAGGLGIAPFPILTEWLLREEKHIITFVGARSSFQIYTQHLKNVQCATDDGSKGFHGTVVDLLEHYLHTNSISKPKIFGCGPTPMLTALLEVARREGIVCELSLEGDMACGIGICQGCPVELVNGKKKYALVCREGPAFNCNDIVLA